MAQAPSPAVAHSVDAELPPQERVPVQQKTAFAFGGLVAGFTLNAPNYLASPIYNITLGLNPLLIGSVIALSRLLDGFLDPIIGHLSDNTKSRWGRRTPYLVLGGVLLGLSFTAMWWLPAKASQNFYFAWFLITSLVFYGASTMFLVPWTALGIELTADYNERTRLNAFVGVAHKAVGMTYAWLYPLAQIAVFQNTLQGVRWVGLGCGIALTICCLVVAWNVPERARQVRRAKPPPFWPSIKAVCSNPSFLRLSVASVLSMTALMTVSSLSLYINIYYVFRGDKVAAAAMAGLFGIVFNVLAIIAVPFVSRVAQRYGKHRTVMVCLAMVAVSAVLKFWAFNPTYPWMQFLIALLHAPGWSAFYVLLNAMTSDVCDEDEYLHGHRREALLGAAQSWMTKAGMSLSYIFAGWILVGSGFDAAKTVQSEHTLLLMRLMFCAVPFVGVALAILALRGYTLSHARLKEIQSELAARNALAPEPVVA